MSIPEEITRATQDAAAQERGRIVGLVLAEFAVHQMAGHAEIASILDALATTIEHLGTERDGRARRIALKNGGSR